MAQGRTVSEEVETRSAEAPSGWARVDPVRWLGPGIVMAATAIGSSHLVLAPRAGALFEYTLLWLVPFSHLFKYPAFEFGPRFAVATGTSLLEGYAKVPGPRGWALWLFLAGVVIQSFSVLAAVLGVSAAVVASSVPVLPFQAWNVGLGLLAAWLVWKGRFDGLSALSKWMLLVLALMTTAAFLATPPPPVTWRHLLVPSLPEGSLVVAAAILGFMPTGIDVSVWHSMWALERRDAWQARHPTDPLRAALADMRLGYGTSFLLALFFYALGAEVLARAGQVPSGPDVVVTLARLYTEVLGVWTLPLFLVAAFFGMYSTTLGVLDGFPRSFAAAVRLLGVENPPERTVFGGFLVLSLVLAFIETWLLPNPVVLVTVAAVATFLLAPITFALNCYCVTRLIPDPALRPRGGLRLWGYAGVACMAGATLFFLGVQLFSA